MLMMRVGFESHRPHHGSANMPIRSWSRPMAALEKITIAPHLTFDAVVAGEAGAPLVLLLHGFAESMHCWRAQVSALSNRSYRAIAPSQRGYSAGAPAPPPAASEHPHHPLVDAG